MDRSEDAPDKRNDTVHQFWCTLDGKKIIVDVDEKGRPWPTPAELKAVSDELSAVAKELNDARLTGGGVICGSEVSLPFLWSRRTYRELARLSHSSSSL